MLQQEIVVNRPLVLSILIDEPDAIETVLPAVISDPETSANVCFMSFIAPSNWESRYLPANSRSAASSRSTSSAVL
jgi:hypothetical protein